MSLAEQSIFLPVVFSACLSPGIKKALMLCIKAFPCRHSEEKVEGLIPHLNLD